MDDYEHESQEKSPEPGSPICLFYFSHPFAIGSHEAPPRSLSVENNTDHVISSSTLKQTRVFRVHRHRSSRTVQGKISSACRRRRRAKKHSVWTLVRYLTESVRLHSRGSRLPCLEDVVNTLQEAWPPENDFTKCYSDEGTTNAVPMAHSHTHQDRGSTGFPSPGLLRRRLSAPETIMRKHMLNQQRSDSTESDSTQLSSISSTRINNSNSFWNRSSTTGSESNLSSRKPYKRDPDLMRKSTLLRRMWSREFTGSVSRLYNEEIFPKKSSVPPKPQSRSPVRSIRSSPEHINKEKAGRKFSPEHVRVNGDIAGSVSSKNKWEPGPPGSNSYSSYTTSDVVSRVSSTSESNKSILDTSSTDIKVSSVCTTTTSTENESFTTTRSTTATTGSHMDDNPDSAYTNSQSYSTYSSSKSNSENNNNNTVEYHGNTTQEMSNANQGEQGQSDNLLVDTQATPDLNLNQIVNDSNDYKCNNPRSETSESVPRTDEQTSELNIVNLSTATLNIIINSSPDIINSKVHENISRLAEHVSATQPTELPKKPESFYLKRKEDVHITADHSRIIKYMISNVGAGSSYSKPIEAPQLVVPRYSAFPRSVSMEVNTSSADSTDKESDTASLVDSLDDPNSPRQSALTPRVKHDDKPVRGDLSALLPDNSSSCKETPRIKSQKGSAFYVPIVQDDDNKNVKTVAEHLPQRVRNKLSKRQQEMEQKKLNAKTKNDNNPNLDSNGNQSENVVNSVVPTELEVTPEVSLVNSGTLKKVKKEKKIKNTLQSLPSYKVNSRGELTLNPNAAAKLKRGLKQTKRKYANNSESSESSTNTITIRQPLWNHHQLKSPVAYESRNEFASDSTTKKSQDKTGFANRIEILEIMECVDHSAEKSLQNQHSKNYTRSKIPVPVQNKMLDISPKQMQMQTVYHAYDITREPEYSPKTDQLIANILIDALNKSDMVEISAHEAPKILQNHVDSATSSEKRPTSLSVNKLVPNRYHQKFEMIPEEKLSSLGSSAEDSTLTLVDQQDVKRENDELKSVEAETQVEAEMALAVPVQGRKCLTVTDASSQTDIAVASADVTHRIPNAYKGKAALAVMKDEDFSTIPKGWITFYMLRKNPGSPDSSTDEGTNGESKANSLNLDEKSEGLELRQLRPVLIKRRFGNKENISELHPHDTNVINISQEPNNNTRISNPLREDESKKALSLDHINETLAVSKKDHYCSSSESSKSQSPVNEHETEHRSACPSLPIALPSRQGRRQSHRRGRYKTTSQNQGTNSSQMPGGWSVTVSGTNSCGQPAPDLEMRLKFPCPQPTSQSDSGLGEEHPRQPKRQFQQQQTNNDFHLPPAKPVQTKKYTVITRKHNADTPDESVNSRSFHYLPDLIKNKTQRLPKGSSVSATRLQCSSDAQSQPAATSQQLGPRPGYGDDDAALEDADASIGGTASSTDAHQLPQILPTSQQPPVAPLQNTAS